MQLQTILTPVVCPVKRFDVISCLGGSEPKQGLAARLSINDPEEHDPGWDGLRTTLPVTSLSFFCQSCVGRPRG